MNDLAAPGSTRARVLPKRPSLEHLKNEAKSRLKLLRLNDQSAKLATAQREVAREYGYPSWRKLRAHIESSFETSRHETSEEKIARLRIAQARPREAINIDAGLLDRFAGYYELKPHAIFSVIREGDELIVRLATQPFFVVLPESDHKFFYKNSMIKAQLTFVIGGEGPASAVILHQHGLEQTAKRISEADAKRIQANLEKRREANEPSPGSKSAIYRLIKETDAEFPNCEFMLEGLARLFREQLQDNRRQLRSWGKLLSVSFVGISQGDQSDVYDVRFANCRTEWRMIMENASQVRSAQFRTYP